MVKKPKPIADQRVGDNMRPTVVKARHPDPDMPFHGKWLFWCPHNRAVQKGADWEDVFTRAHFCATIHQAAWQTWRTNHQKEDET